MKIRFGNVVLTAIAVGFGWMALLGYLVAPALIAPFLTWGSVLAAVAVVIGALNLMRVHIRKMLEASPGWLYSGVTVLGFIAALGVGFLGPYLQQGAGLATPWNDFMFQHVIGATSTAIAAMLAFFLLFAGYRLARRPFTLTTAIFLITAVISLISMAPILGWFPLPELNWVWVWLSQVPAVAGARGLLLGVALGIVATGLRILLAMDRPYGD